MAREELNTIVSRLLGGETDSPDQLSKDLLQLTASMYNVSQEVLEANIEYAKKWEAERHKYQSDKACDMTLMGSEEYRKKESKRAAEKMLVELLRSIKKRLAVMMEELKL